jgi:hypothetical protein
VGREEGWGKGKMGEIARHRGMVVVGGSVEAVGTEEGCGPALVAGQSKACD